MRDIKCYKNKRNREVQKDRERSHVRHTLTVSYSILTVLYSKYYSLAMYKYTNYKLTTQLVQLYLHT